MKLSALFCNAALALFVWLESRSEDPLIPVRAGRATAKALRRAHYLEMPGMGHDLPAPLFTRFADEIAAVAARGRAS